VARSKEKAAEKPALRQTVRKDEVIQLRASAETKALLNRAAALKGQKLSEFVLMSAREKAENTILQQHVFFLDPKAYDEFLAILDAPPEVSDEVRARYARKPAWER